MDKRLSRQDFLRICALGFWSLLAGQTACAKKEPIAPPKESIQHPPAVNPVNGNLPAPVEALKNLIDGNLRFSRGGLLRQRRDSQRRQELLNVQKPIAAILSCADSRVPPEILFDQGIGDLFIVREAGNVAGPVALGSLEYAVEHLGVTLILILGHQNCGAVSAAVGDGETKGHITDVVEAILPASTIARIQGGDVLDEAININVRNGVRKIKNSKPILEEFADLGKVEVVGARYNLDTGLVSWLTASERMMALFPNLFVGEPMLFANATAVATSAGPLPANPTWPAPVSAPSVSTTANPLIGPVPLISSPPPGGFIGQHIVREGEDIYMIAAMYQMDPKLIAQVNRLSNLTAIYPGQRLWIPIRAR